MAISAVVCFGLLVVGLGIGVVATLARHRRRSRCC